MIGVRTIEAAKMEKNADLLYIFGGHCDILTEGERRWGKREKHNSIYNLIASSLQMFFFVFYYFAEHHFTVCKLISHFIYYHRFLNE